MMTEFALFGFVLNDVSEALLSVLILFTILTFLRLLYKGTLPEKYLPESTFLILFGLFIGTIIAVIPTDGAG